MFLLLMYITLLSVGISIQNDETESNFQLGQQNTVQYTGSEEETEHEFSSSTMQASDSVSNQDNSEYFAESSSHHTSLPAEHHSETVAFESSMYTNSLETLIEEDVDDEGTAITDIDEPISFHTKQHGQHSHETFPTDEEFPTEETVSTTMTTATQTTTNEDETEFNNNENENQNTNTTGNSEANKITEEKAHETINSTTVIENKNYTSENSHETFSTTEQQNIESNTTTLDAKLSKFSHHGEQNESRAYQSSHVTDFKTSSDVEAPESAEKHEEQSKKAESTSSASNQEESSFDEQMLTTKRSEDNNHSRNEIEVIETTLSTEGSESAKVSASKSYSAEEKNYTETTEAENKEEKNKQTLTILLHNPPPEYGFETTLPLLESFNTTYIMETTTESRTITSNVTSTESSKLDESKNHGKNVHNIENINTTKTLEITIEDDEETIETTVTYKNNWKSDNTSETIKQNVKESEGSTNKHSTESTERITTSYPSNKDLQETVESTLGPPEHNLEATSKKSHEEVNLEATKQNIEMNKGTPTTHNTIKESEATSEKIETTATENFEGHNITTKKESHLKTSDHNIVSDQNNEKTSMPKENTESDETSVPTSEYFQESEITAVEDIKAKSHHKETYATSTDTSNSRKDIDQHLVKTHLSSINTPHGGDITPHPITPTFEIEKQPLDFETSACDYCDQTSNVPINTLERVKNKTPKKSSIQHDVSKIGKITEHSVTTELLSTIEMEGNVIDMETTPCQYCTTISGLTTETQEVAQLSSQKTEHRETKAQEISTLTVKGCSPESTTKHKIHSTQEKQDITMAIEHRSETSQESLASTTKPGQTEHNKEQLSETTEETKSEHLLTTINKSSEHKAKSNESISLNEQEYSTLNAEKTTMIAETSSSIIASEAETKTETPKEILTTEEEISSRSDEHLENNTHDQDTTKSSQPLTERGMETSKSFHNPIIIVVRLYKQQKLNKSVLENILSSSLPEVSIEYADIATESDEYTKNSNATDEEFPEFDKTENSSTQKATSEEIYHKVNSQNECTKDDFENGKHCFCNISSYLRILDRRIENGEHIRSKINYCDAFFKVKKLILKRSSSPRSYRSLINFDHTKPIGNLELQGVDGIFEHDFNLPVKGRNFYNLPSETVKIPCSNDSTESPESDKETAYTWNFHSLSSVTSHDLPDKAKEIVLHGLSLTKAGNYTCTIMKKESVQGKVWHKLEIVTFPIYEINLNIFYRINDSCSLQIGDDLKTYLPKVISPILCSNKREICHLDMERPRCLTREDDNYYNVSIHIKTSADVVFLIESHCDINCKLAFYENVVSMIYRNAEIVERISVRSEINSLVITTFTPHLEGHNGSAVTTKSPRVASICPAGFGLEGNRQRVCVICPKNTFSRENQSFCRMCPSGQYQPLVSSESCLPCNSPVDDTMCLRMLYTDTSIFKIYVAAAFGMVTILVIVIIIWTSGMKDNSAERDDYYEESLKRKPPNKPVIRGASARAPPQIPPPDF